MIQLGLLQELENRLEGVPLVELPDLCGGTSVGQ
jgi:patatin-like phospholipase/acyl hydrolase